MNLVQIFQHMILISLLGSVLALGIMAIKFVLGPKLNAKWHYAIWFVLFLRLLIPYTLSSSFSIWNFIPYDQQTVLQSISVSGSEEPSGENITQVNDNADNAVTGPLTDNKNPQQTSENQYIYWQAMAIVWMAGLVAILLYILLVNALFISKVKKLPACCFNDALRILEECKFRLNINSEVSIVYDTSRKSPALFGLIRPRIIISPEVIEKLSSEELRYVFLHELSHLKRRDLLVNACTLMVQAVYWFNPLIWYALQKMKQDCEIACDATVLRALEPQNHKNYGQTIISLLQMLSEPHWAPGTLGFVSKFNKRRIIMISSNKKTTIVWAIVALAALLIVGCSSLNKPGNSIDNGSNQQITNTVSPSNDPAANTQPDANNSSNPAEANSVVYKNTQYGFNFNLPSGWQGYTIVSSKWEGNDIQSGKISETGPMISIRHPQWTSQNPRQDIPIMIFTISQWNLLQQEKFHIGAAPIGPSELGRNGTYVFALPARYNFAFPTGFEEVEKIMESHPLKAL